MIQLVMPRTKYFTKEKFLGRLESIEVKLRQSRELARLETTFSALKIQPNLSRSASTREDFVGNNRSNEDKKIKEGLTLLVRREKDDKKIFKCWTCDRFGHYASRCPKREKKYKGKFKLERDKDRNFLYANEDDEFDERDQTESDYELGFLAIKEDDLDREIRKERALVSQF